MDKKETEHITEKLRHEDYAVRSDAAKRLIEMNNEVAISILHEACTDERRETREIAAMALAEVGDERAIDPLLNGLAMGSDWHLWNNVHLALVHIGEPAVPAILNALHDPRFPNWDTRSFTFVQSLMKIRDPRSLDPLIDLLLDPTEKNIHSGVAAALGEHEDSKAAGALLWYMEQYPESRSFEACLVALNKINDPRVFETLIALLDHEKESVRQKAVKGLGLQGDKRAIPYIEPFCTNKSLKMKDWAVRALGQIAEEEAVEILEKALADPNKKIRKRARKALENIGTEKAIRILETQ